MKEKIILLIGGVQAAKVEDRAKKRGHADIWSLAEERARIELGDAAEESALIHRAAVRAQQIVGCFPRFVDVAPAATAVTPEPARKGKRAKGATELASETPAEAPAESPAE